jgi:hypothetical protein
VARRAYAGLGSIALREHLLTGWKSKIFVLILLGFAGTDFVITMTLSAADAARHAIANPYLHSYVGDSPIRLTLLLLLLLTAVFVVGFREAIGLARNVALPYLALNLIVLLRGVWEIALHPALLHRWRFSLSSHGDWTAIFIASALIFPKLALGLSGFETGVSVMPLVASEEADTGRLPLGRIRATRCNVFRNESSSFSSCCVRRWLPLVNMRRRPRTGHGKERPRCSRVFRRDIPRYLFPIH